MNRLTALQVPKGLILAVGGGIVLNYIINRLIPSYKMWLSLGKGGPPANIFGYLFAACVKPFSRETRSWKDIYDSPSSRKTAMPFETFSKLLDLDTRTGQRPVVPEWIPQRQIDQINTSYRAILTQYIYEQAANSNGLLEVKRSYGERHGPALFRTSQDTMNQIIKATKYEIWHVHDKDSSLHCVLSLKDAKMVVEQGWGERHGLSGVILPVTYTMLYSPRSDEELSVVKKIIDASVDFCLL
ncbi:hypothetical protein V1511DRAFT_325182 [Dipodascopsis uninucleata]